MPFRLDDVLHMQWAREHTLWDAFNVERGEIVRSVRPVFAMTIWLLTHTAGTDHYFPWHLVLVGSFLIGLAYAGKTARYIVGQDSALYFTSGLFWIAFLPILNVLFWYGDLTFTIELMFIAPAWYYGLRGLLEGKIGLWSVGILCGILAVLAKEPAILLVHSVYVGTFMLCFRSIGNGWRTTSGLKKIFAAFLYLMFFVISLKLYFASPTRSNRFFSMGAISHEKLVSAIHDRLSYYSESLLNAPARILLVTPLIYSLLRKVIQKSNSFLKTALVIICSLIISFLCIKSIIAFSIVLLGTVIFNIITRDDKRRHLILLPFALSAVIILGVLLITVMLVKTQLTELSFVLLVISGVYWAELLKDVVEFAKPYFAKKNIRYGFVFLCIIGAVGGTYAAFPQIKSKEKLLSDVRDVRYNSNDALKWMGANLPQKSTVLLTGTNLYGIGEADDMTSKDDEYKLYAQYTFLLGYVRSYFQALHREDIGVAYLIDSVKLSRILDSCRSEGNYYLFLQTGLDGDRFHGIINGKKQLTPHDSLLVRYNRGPFPSEVWKLVQ
jgi:hypothetical protein